VPSPRLSSRLASRPALSAACAAVTAKGGTNSDFHRPAGRPFFDCLHRRSGPSIVLAMLQLPFLLPSCSLASLSPPRERGVDPLCARQSDAGADSPDGARC
jgi:hypothetical protein